MKSPLPDPHRKERASYSIPGWRLSLVLVFLITVGVMSYRLGFVNGRQYGRIWWPKTWRLF